MESFEERFYRSSGNLWTRLGRNLRLLLWLGRAAWSWLVPGLKVRRAYRRAQRTGRPVALERILGDQ